MISIENLKLYSKKRLYFNNKNLDKYTLRILGYKTIFLSHSHKDRDLALGFTQILQESGCKVYIDWLDENMPEKPNKETANRIKSKINENDFFVFLATDNSSNSKWCPWEIGYADGIGLYEQIFIVPTRNQIHSYGQEYLDIYKRIEFASDGSLHYFEPKLTRGLNIKTIW